MKKREKLLCCYAVLLGVASLSSLITYGVSGIFWWVEIPRYDGEREFILGMLHITTAIGGVVGASLLAADWLQGGDEESQR